MLRDRFSNGYFTVGAIRRIPIRFHLATPIGLFVFSSFSFAPAAWIAVLLIILIHELGHALIVRGYNLDVVSIDIHAFGGSCRWAGFTTERQESAIAWGGVLTQAVLLALTNGAARVVHPQHGTHFAHFWETLHTSNFFIMLFNLIPVPPLDGAKAWRLLHWRNFAPLVRRGKRAVSDARLQSQMNRLDRIDPSDDRPLH